MGTLNGVASIQTDELYKISIPLPLVSAIKTSHKTPYEF